MTLTPTEISTRYEALVTHLDQVDQILVRSKEEIATVTWDQTQHAWMLLHQGGEIVLCEDREGLMETAYRLMELGFQFHSTCDDISMNDTGDAGQFLHGLVQDYLDQFDPAHSITLDHPALDDEQEVLLLVNNRTGRRYRLTITEEEGGVL